MMEPRLFLAGLISILATACGHDTEVQSTPRPATCNVIAPDLVDQAEVGRLGEELVTPNSPHGRGDTGGNITDIVQITNLTSCGVRVESFDGYGPASTRAIEIGPGNVFTGSLYVPWGDSVDKGQNMQIWFKGRPYFRIWQKERRVAFRTAAELARLRAAGTTDDNADTAPSVPGQASQGGRRHLYIAMTADGRPYFKIEAVQAR